MSYEPFDLAEWVAAGRPMRNGLMVNPKDLQTKNDEDDKKETIHKFHYVTRSGIDPHPPIITTGDHKRIIHPQPQFAPPAVSPFCYPPQSPAAPMMQYAYGYPQYQYPYPQYQYPHAYTYTTTPTSPATQPVYVPGGYYTHPTYMTYAAPQPASSDKKKTKVKVKHHNWYGRTAAEVERDDAVLASKSGANEPTPFKPDAKPDDQFWVVDTDGARMVRSFYEIENVHKPGKWYSSGQGNLYFVKEKKEDEDEEESSSSDDSD